VKPGFVAACNEIMAREGSSYIGAQYGRQVNVGFPIGLTHKKWVHGWQPVLGTEYPSWAINPGQVFGRAYVERFLEFPDLDRVLDLSDATGVWGPEEFIYPTMADAMGCNPVAYPSQSAIGARRHSPAAIRDFIADPRVHWIHKVGQKPDDYDRAIVMALAAGTQPDWEDAERSYRPQTAIRRIGRRALKAKRYQLAGHFRRA
jgi:hypothetical protein